MALGPVGEEESEKSMTEFYTRRILTARKQHMCSSLRPTGRIYYSACVIEPGTRYVQVAQKFDGEFRFDKLCMFHAAAIEAAFAGASEPVSAEGIDYRYIHEWWDGAIDREKAGWFECLKLVRTEMRELKAGNV